MNEDQAPVADEGEHKRRLSFIASTAGAVLVASSRVAEALKLNKEACLAPHDGRKNGHARQPIDSVVFLESY
jgi:hypothetical protein